MAGRNRHSYLVVLVTLAVLGGLLGLAGPAGAVVASTTGQLIKIAPPTDVKQIGLCSPDKVFTFDEQQGVTLGADVPVDYKTVGTYTDYGPPSLAPVPAGTVIDSHFLHSNLGSCAGTPNREGTWKFSQDILGVIVARPRLVKSDFLGSPTTLYPGSVPSREFDFGNGTSADLVQIIDSRTIYVKLQTPFSNADQMRVLTKHNSAPTPVAGGPYAGNEGSTLTLAGSATDPDGDPITKSWTFVKSASPGTTCTYGATTTFTPTINCNDDALITATLSVTDGFHPAVTSVANVTISNTPPVIGTVTVPAAPVALGASVTVSATFTEAGTHDTHTASIAWGDTTSSTASVNEIGHTLSASHVYAAPGFFTPTVTLNDDDGGTDSVAGGAIEVVGPPTANAGGPYSVDEGSTATLAGTATGHTPLTTTWGFVPGVADAGTLCTYAATTTLSPTVACNDDLVVASTLTVSDGINAPVVHTANVTVDNVAPTLGALTATAGPIVVGQPVTVGGNFTDPGANDSHTSSYDWGDMSTSSGSVTESGGSGSVSGTHSFGAPGDYLVSVDVNDGDGGIDTRTIHVYVNSPPTAAAGGPYTGPEGTTLTLSGTAGDVDGDPLTYSWSFSATPAVCSYGATNSLAPTVLCTDDAVVNGTLSVSDGVNAPVTSNATVTVGNVAPSLGTVTTTASPVAVNGPVTASVPFNDAGTSDTHTATISWGDGTTTALVVESGGSGTASGTHTYPTAGSYQISITVTDDDGDSSTALAAALLVVNSAPTVSAGGPYSVVEGASLNLAGTASDPENDPLTIGWTFAVSGSPGTSCSTTNANTLTPSIVCNDNATVTAVLSVSDGINPAVTSNATVTVTNLAPNATPITPAPLAVSVGTPVTVTTSFTDVGTHDTHFALVFWGDGITGATVSETLGSGTATASHAYSVPGSYTVIMQVIDDDTGATLLVATAPVVVT